jgi:ketosteroid isomerase-like protein
MGTTDRLERNKAAVRRYLEAVEAFDLEAVADALTEDVVQHYQRPSIRNDDGSSDHTANRGRDGILHELKTYFPQLYKPGTVKITVEHMIAEGDYVACRFILAATTARKGEAYENFYNFYYRCRDGRVAEYWEYVDSLYAEKLLFT